MSIFSNRFSDAKQEAGAYTRAVMGLLGDRDPVPVLERTPGLVAEHLAGLSADDIARPELPGKWSMLQVTRHLADSDLVWGYRLRRIIAEDRPAIQGYDQDLWSEHLHYERADLAEALAELRSVRAGNLRLVHMLGPAERARVGIHTERGEESIEHLLHMYAGHDILHLNQLARIRSSLVGAIRG